MKKIYTLFIAGALLLGVNSCTSDFDEINTNPAAFNKLTNDDYAGMLRRAARYGLLGGDYQLNQGLHSDLYAQYFTTTVTYFSSDRYEYHTGWDYYLWYVDLTTVAPCCKTIQANFEENTAEYAISQVIYAASFLELTDRAGAVPYGAGNGEAVAFVDAKTAYHSILDDLSHAASVLSSSSSTIYANRDMMFGGDVAKWAKYANTLRLRTAMRLVNKEPDYAKTQAEAAYTAGVMTSTADDAWFEQTGVNDFRNYHAQTGVWNEFGMSSTIYSYLKGWSDPRLPIFFQPAASTGVFHSARNAMPSSDITIANQTTSSYVSNMGTKWIVYDGTSPSGNYDVPRLILPAAEAFFLRAEGALRGWNMGGSAKDLYEEGIRTSMTQWGVSSANAEAYLNVTSDPAEPDDYYKSPAVCTNLPVKWVEGDTEKELQQIITQKWLALYTASPNSWAEYRRTGYPILYNIIKSDDTDIPVGQFIQRLKYPDQLKNSEGEEVMQKAIELNGASKDSQATKLYYAK